MPFIKRMTQIPDCTYVSIRIFAYIGQWISLQLHMGVDVIVIMLLIAYQYGQDYTQGNQSD